MITFSLDKAKKILDEGKEILILEPEQEYDDITGVPLPISDKKMNIFINKLEEWSVDANNLKSFLIKKNIHNDKELENMSCRYSSDAKSFINILKRVIKNWEEGHYNNLTVEDESKNIPKLSNDTEYQFLKILYSKTKGNPHAFSDDYTEITNKIENIDSNVAYIIFQTLKDKGLIKSVGQSGCKLTTSGFKSLYNMNNQPKKSENIFVVHGRNKKVRDFIFNFLRAINLKPLEWNDVIESSGKASPHTKEAIEKALEKSQAVLVLLTGDDEVKLKEKYFDKENDSDDEKELYPQARPNVIFEAGMAFGTHPDTTIVVQFGKVKQFSDIYGINYIKFDGKYDCRNSLANRLKNAGCSVDTSGNDWIDLPMHQ